MTTSSRDDVLSVGTDIRPEQPSMDWVAALATSGPDQVAALERLHRLLLRASRHQVRRMHSMLAGLGSDRIEEIANQAADEAMVCLLAKLATFEGRSSFSTWAYKFAILQAAVEVRRHAWAHREVELTEPELIVALTPSPEQHAEAADLAQAVRAAIEEALTPHQRRVVLALLVTEVQIDVLAERLGTTRNALYKSLHDARTRLRAHLAGTGHLPPNTAQAGPR